MIWSSGGTGWAPRSSENFSPLSSGGLWEAVRFSPPWAAKWRMANDISGVDMYRGLSGGRT